MAQVCGEAYDPDRSTEPVQPKGPTFNLGLLATDSPIYNVETPSPLLPAPSAFQMATYLEELQSSDRTRPVQQISAPYQYQVSMLKSYVEYNIGPPGKRVWADSIDFERGLAQDAKYRANNSSPHVPSSAPEFFREEWSQDLDDMLLDYKSSIEHPSCPLSGVEFVVSEESVAEELRQRIARLAVPAVVVVRA